MRRKTYSTCVLLTKRKEFLKFLNEIGLPDDRIVSTFIRGDYIFYSINLKNLPNSSEIWQELDTKIPTFI